jgi:hypothetical protein
MFPFHGGFGNLTAHLAPVNPHGRQIGLFFNNFS